MKKLAAAASLSALVVLAAQSLPHKHRGPQAAWVLEASERQALRDAPASQGDSGKSGDAQAVSQPSEEEKKDIEAASGYLQQAIKDNKGKIGKDGFIHIHATRHDWEKMHSPVLALAGSFRPPLPSGNFSLDSAVFLVERKESNASILQRYPNLILVAPAFADKSKKPSFAGFLRLVPMHSDKGQSRARFFRDGCGMLWSALIRGSGSGAFVEITPTSKGYLLAKEGKAGKCQLLDDYDAFSSAARAHLKPRAGEKLFIRELEELGNRWEPGQDTQAVLDAWRGGQPYPY